MSVATIDLTEIRLIPHTPCPLVQPLPITVPKPTKIPAKGIVQSEDESDPENDVLTYNYVVTGGKIIGVGAKVVWDHKDSPAGKYSITVGVDDGPGICGTILTQSITVVR